MKNRIKRTIAKLLIVVMLLTTAPLTGIDSLFASKASAAYAVGDHIEYGNYPQSKVTDESTLALLDSLDKNWISYRYYSGSGYYSDGEMSPDDYMYYADIDSDGDGLRDYRAVYIEEYRSTCTGYKPGSSGTFQDDNGYFEGEVYYFKFEPISWRILDPDDGLIMTEKIMDSQAYNNYIISSGGTYYRYYSDPEFNNYANDYYHSSIRQWLNNDFYNTAFTPSQANNIRKDVTINNDYIYGSSSPEYNSQPSKDKIFILSYDEVKTSAYGFSSNPSDHDIARQTNGTDYAKSQGLRVYGSENSYWWLRTAGDRGFHVITVISVSNALSDVFYTYTGVRPACRLSSLKSDVSKSTIDNNTSTTKLRYGDLTYTIDNHEVTIVDCDTSVVADITVPSEIQGYHVTRIGDNAFAGCIGISSITLPNCIKEIGESAFFWCRSLCSINMPEELTHIKQFAFGKCNNLSVVTIPKKIVKIDKYAFSLCTGLRKIYWNAENAHDLDFDDNIFDRAGTETQGIDVIFSNEVERIPKYAFCINNTSLEYESAPNIKSVSIDENITSIGEGAFGNCKYLETVYYSGTKEQWDKIKIDSYNDELLNANIIFNRSLDDTKYQVYIDATKYFAENTSMPEIYGFYESVWKYLPDRWRLLAPAKVWTSLGDVGKVMTFSFDDLGITADYYDIFLTELIVRMNNTSATDEIEIKAMSGLEKTWGALKGLLKSSDQWDESVKDGKKFFDELEGVFFEKKDKEVSEETKNALSKLLRGIYKNKPEAFDKVFSKLNMANVISGYISDGFDIANYFIKTVNAYQSAVAYKEYGQELFDILYEAAANMENDKYSNWFKNAIDKYYSTAMSDDILISAIKNSLGSAIYLAYDIVFKELIKNVTYSVCAKVLGCTAGAFAASAFAVSLAYNLTYQVLDRISGMGDKATAIYIMNYISDVEKGLSVVEDRYQKSLTKYPTFKNAQNYSLAYNVLRNTNLYLYQAAYNFSSINKKTDDMKIFTLFTELWKKINLDKGIEYLNNAKIVSVQCPVDVIIYDSSDNVVFKVVNEKITDYDENITAMVFDGKKTIMLPDNCDYRIEITSREKGKMDYYISELSSDYPERKLEYYDLPLVENNVYSGTIPAEQLLDKSEYSLLNNGKEFTCSYDSIDSNETCGDDHVFGEWTVERESDCVSAGIKYHVCKICGIRSAEYVEPIGHIDSNADGKCDRCGEKMTAPVNPPQSDPSANCSHICHKGGISKFFYKIALFFWKLFKTHKECSCGALHY